MGPACAVLTILLCFLGGFSCLGAESPEPSVALVPTNFIPKEENQRQVTNNESSIDEPRGKRKKNFMRTLMSVKLMAMSVIIPGVMALALFASWKGITISLLAFTIALFAGLKNLAGSKKGAEKSIQHVFVSKSPSVHEHWWRKLSEPTDHSHHDEHADYKDISPYREYYR